MPGGAEGRVRAMPDPAFVDKLNEQIGYEFGASQQYVAAAVYYDSETLPRLAAFFYAQALEERNHAMMMVQYLLDAGVDPVIPGIDAPRSKFADIVEPVAVALEQEKRVSDQINALAAVAREHDDYSSENFMQWFIKEQVEEVASMSDLLRVVERSRENPMFAEDFLAREHPEAEGEDATAPAAAGGALSRAPARRAYRSSSSERAKWYELIRRPLLKYSRWASWRSAPTPESRCSCSHPARRASSASQRISAAPWPRPRRSARVTRSSTYRCRPQARFSASRKPATAAASCSPSSNEPTSR